MERQELLAEYSEIVKRHGPWTDHNIDLGHGVYTIGSDTVSEKLRRILQIVADSTGSRKLQGLRVLDLGCLEGQYAIELARQGAETVGIEGREANLAQAEFAKRALGLDNAVFHHDDIRNVTAARYGEFDVVLCLGVLYHLNAPAVFELVDNIGSLCRRVAIFDTYISLRSETAYEHKGRQFWGRNCLEHDPAALPEERLQDLWASLDNTVSMWPTFNSLLNMLIGAGFTTVSQCHAPVELNKPSDRVTLLAIKGSRVPILNMPRMNDLPWPALPENFRPSPSPHNQRFYEFSKRIVSHIPRQWRRGAKSMLRRLGLKKGADPWERDWNERYRGRGPTTQG